EVQDGTPPALAALLLEELRDDAEEGASPLGERDLHVTGPLLELSDLLELPQLDIPAPRDPPFTPRTPPELGDPAKGIFDVMRERDVLVHHPFDSFAASVEEFLEAAARDDHVVAIKMTLYRTSGDTAIVKALIDA